MSQQKSPMSCGLLNKNEIDLVIYHGKCSDGFGSALAVWLYFKDHDGKNQLGHVVEYWGATFNQIPPDIKGKNVLLCDFAYKYDIMSKFLVEANSLLVIDHHKSNQDNLGLLDPKYKIFEMNHSASTLVWNFMFPDQKVPLLIQYIEDRDIWTKKLPHTDEISAYLFSLPFEFEEYAKLLTDENVFQTQIIPVAIGMTQQNELYINQATNNGELKFVKIGDLYYLVILLNSTVLKSEIGNKIFDKYPNADFSCIYSVSEGANYLSLRSTNERVDVAVIASKFGGGGHRNASGLTSYSGQILPWRYLGDYQVNNMLQIIYSTTIQQYNVINLNSCDLKHHLAKYLLQTKSTDSQNQRLQVGYVAQFNREKIPYQYYQLSCVWNYDGYKKETWFTIAWTSDLTIETIKLLFGQELNFTYNDKNNYIFFSRPGLTIGI